MSSKGLHAVHLVFRRLHADDVEFLLGLKPGCSVGQKCLKASRWQQPPFLFASAVQRQKRSRCSSSRAAGTTTASDHCDRDMHTRSRCIIRLDLRMGALSLLASPAAGQSNYAAANAALEAWARGQAARGAPAMAVQWGAWSAGDQTSVAALLLLDS